MSRDSQKFRIQAGPPPHPGADSPLVQDIRRNLAQEAFDAAREELLSRWGELVQVTDLTDALQQAQNTSWALVQTAMLFQWNGEARQ